MRKLVASCWWEALCLLTYLLLAGSQLFVRPIIGVAGNGDFPKVLWPHNICDPDKERDIYNFVTPRYVIDPACSWDSGLHSSETLVVVINKWIAELTGHSSFSITGAGKLHLAVMLSALAMLLWGLRASPPLLRYGLPALAILIFSDVAYVGYLNSFYMDAASLAFLCATVAAGVAAVLRPQPWILSAFAATGSLFAYSKTQHTFTAFLLAAFAAWMAVRAPRPVVWLWTASALLIAASAAALVAQTPFSYKAEPFYSVIFLRILPSVSEPTEILEELNLPASYSEYSGTHAYSERSPIPNPRWRADFSNRVTQTRILLFYLRNPEIAFRLLYLGLRDDAPGIRPTNMGNFTPDAGVPPLTLSRHFALWSDSRAWLLRAFPLHVVFLYALTTLVPIICIFRRNWASRWPLYPFALALSLAGLLEFAGATLLDGTETARHLFFFQAVTEFQFLFLFAALAARPNPPENR